MNKVRLLIIVSTGLLLANIVLVTMFLLRPKEGPGGKRFQEPKRLIIERLQFDKTQQEQYELLIEKHRSTVRSLNESLNDSRKKLMFTLTKDGDRLNADSLQNEIGNKLSSIEKVRYEHFTAIQQLCRPDQMKSFDDLIEALPFLLTQGPGERSGPPMGPDQMGPPEQMHPNMDDTEEKQLPGKQGRKTRKLDSLVLE